MNRRQKMTVARMRNAGVLASTAIMLVGLVVGLAFFARPATSTVEKRELTPFPAPSAATLADGRFFTDASLWYADTYPLREPMVAAAQRMKALYGIAPKAKLIGGNVTADEIDDASGSEGPVTEFRPVEAPEGKPMDEAMQEQLMAGLYVTDGAAYNIYYFVDDSAATYIEGINALAEKLDGQATVYSMLIPNGGAIMLDEETLDSLGGSDQRQAIEYFYGRYDDRAVPVFIFDTLAKHKDDYIFFRTDHHWTQMGAYYSYLEFCRASGKEPKDVLSWKRMDFDGFLGTFYNETSDPSLIPDTVTAYVPPSANDVEYVDQNGVENETNVVTDVSTWGSGTLYYCFGVGDYPLSHVANPALSDGSACLLLKDSYGNCFAPELVEHYQDLWVIDFRYSDTDIVQFVREHNITDVIVENNISIATSDVVARALYDQATGAVGQDGDDTSDTEEPETEEDAS